MRLLILLLVYCMLLFSCATSEGALFETVSSSDAKAASVPDEQKGDSSGTTTDENSKTVAEDAEETETGIRIVTTPNDANIYMNSEFLGKSPVLVEVDPGTYRVTASKSGYYSETHWVTYESGSLTVVEIDLDRITGYLHVKTTPENARVDYGGAIISQGVSELPIGTYSLSVRAFGYEDHGQTIRILEKQTTYVEVALERADFALRDVTSSRIVLNPANPGKLGFTNITFEVTSWGVGELIIKNEAHETIFSKNLPRFDTWEQSTEWNGRTDGGSVPGDGRYEIAIEARGEGADKTVSRSIYIDIDSTLVISYRSMWSGLSGAAYAPSPLVLPSGSFQVSVATMGHYDPGLSLGRFPTQASVRMSLLNNTELDLHGTLFIHGREMTPYAFGAGLKYQFSRPKTKFFTLGLTGRVTYVGNTTTDTLTNFTGINVGASAAVKAGPLLFILAPEIVGSPFSVSYGESAIDQTFGEAFYVWSYGRLGILLDFGTLTAGVSSALRTIPFRYGFAVHLPFSGGAEVHWLIPKTQIVLSAYVTGEFAAIDNYYVMAGGAVGVIN